MKFLNFTNSKSHYLFTAWTLLSLFFFNNALAQQMKNHKHMPDSTLKMRQRMIHSRSPLVMPFDMNKVTHYFIDTKEGGILSIKAKNHEDTAQVILIRDHLKKEHHMFSNADFSDPKTLHGMHMPGLAVLSKSKGNFNVDYADLPAGAQLTFTSKDTTVINAIHTWFAAQLKDHGKDAKAKQ